jgi:methylated-DNA-[protein]-cysteine S-methyltransferase
MRREAFTVERLPTSIGTMLIVSDAEDRLRALDWEDYEARMQRLLRLHYGAGNVELREATPKSAASRSLQRYFDGELAAIDRLEVKTAGTEFQRAVWRELRTIPVGKTLTYGTLAQRIGRADAVRAVGHANGSNPLGIVVPCHRVVGADRSLTGYGGGIERKRWLLEHEGAFNASLLRA